MASAAYRRRLSYQRWGDRTGSPHDVAGSKSRPVDQMPAVSLRLLVAWEKACWPTSPPPPPCLLRRRRRAPTGGSARGSVARALVCSFPLPACPAAGCCGERSMPPTQTTLKWPMATALTRMRFGSNGATAPYELGLPPSRGRPLRRWQHLLSSPNQDASHPMHRATKESGSLRVRIEA